MRLKDHGNLDLPSSAVFKAGQGFHRLQLTLEARTFSEFWAHHIKHWDLGFLGKPKAGYFDMLKEVRPTLRRAPRAPCALPARAELRAVLVRRSRERGWGWTAHGPCIFVHSFGSMHPPRFEPHLYGWPGMDKNRMG